MAKPTKHAILICVVLSILTIIGAGLSIWQRSPIILVFFLLPTIIYEVYRTEGKSTKLASWVLLAIFILEIIFIVFKVNFDMGAYLGKTETTIAGYNVPLGDIKIVGPIIIAILSVILFIKTRGIYTRWLAVVIFLGSFLLIYLLNPLIFQSLLKFGIDQGLEKGLQQIQ